MGDEENKVGSVRGKTISWQWKRKKIKETVGEEENKEGSERGKTISWQWKREGGCGEPAVGKSMGLIGGERKGKGGKRRRGCELCSQ